MLFYLGTPLIYQLLDMINNLFSKLSNFRPREVTLNDQSFTMSSKLTKNKTYLMMFSQQPIAIFVGMSSVSKRRGKKANCRKEKFVAKFRLTISRQTTDKR